MRILPSSDWANHPILSRLGYKSDFDGDGTLRLKDYDPSEYQACGQIAMEVSEDDGASWKSVAFDDNIVYIDGIGAGWYWLASSHPFEDLLLSSKAEPKAIWRAKVAS
jgi:hypothetical protein